MKSTITKKGYQLIRNDFSFNVREMRLAWSETANQSHSDLWFHSQLNVYSGISKSDCRTLVMTWLSFFDDSELIEHASKEIEELFSQELPVVEVSTKQVN